MLNIANSIPGNKQTGMKVRLNIENHSAVDSVPDSATLTSWAEAAFRDCADVSVELGLRIVDEDESAALNERYRHKTGSTNVLSFPYEDPPGVSTDLLGDLVICAPVVQREAREQDRGDTAHWAHMLVHGIMHLRGYNHENEEDTCFMQDKEIQVLKKLGFSSPYH